MLLSIITVNRNNLAGLQETAQSVLAQTDQNFEWVVIDGASTDGGAEFTRSITRPNTITVSEPDKGIYDAMNKGIDLCHGDYCLFLNSGDSFHQDDSLARCLTEMQRRPEVDVFRFAIAKTLSSKITDIIHPAKQINGFFLYLNVIPHQATIIKTSCLRKYHYDTRYKIAADFDFFRKIYLFEEIKDIAIDFILSDFDGSGVSSQNPDALLAERERSFINLLGRLTYDDYQRFVYGETILEKWIAKFKRNRLFTAMSIVVLSPLYFLWRFLSVCKKSFNFFVACMKNVFCSRKQS